MAMVPMNSGARSAVGTGRLLYLALVLAATLAGCRAGVAYRSEADLPSRPLADVLADHSSGLMAIPGVTAVAESRTPRGEPCVLILVKKLTPDLRSRLPEKLERWPVVVEESGEIRAMPDSGR